MISFKSNQRKKLRVIFICMKCRIIMHKMLAGVTI